MFIVLFMEAVIYLQKNLTKIEGKLTYYFFKNIVFLAY